MKKLFYKISAISLILAMSFSLLLHNISAEEPTTNATEVFADLAFPTARGYANYTNAFRGGRVIEVTNLNDSGEGSLRWALEEETGPRIVVFKVGGVIELKSSITIGKDNGQVYIAGQTAPGDGITITKRNIVISNTSDVIIRHLRIRTGDECIPLQCVSAVQSENIILDHCSFSWGFYGCVELYSSKKITVQNCIIAEGLNQKDTLIEDASLLSKMSAAFQISSENISIHHNLITNCRGTVWYLLNEDWILNRIYSDNIDISNNVVYNSGNYNAYGFCHHVHLTNNYYKKGPVTSTYELIATRGVGYLSGNKMVDVDGTVIINDTDNQLQLIAKDAFLEGVSAQPLFAVNITPETADEAYETVINHAGATVPKRDYFDTRYVKEVTEGTYTYGGKGIIKSQTETEGYPDNTTFTGGETPVDTDHDGMPDEWELNHGLNPEYYYDACQVYLSDNGYTNIELYINELAGDPVRYSENPVVQYNPVIPTATPEVTETPTDTPEPVVTEAPTPEIVYEKGDINFDGVVNAADALLILKHAAKLEYLSEEQLNIADLKENLIIDASDALEVLKIAAKL